MIFYLWSIDEGSVTKKGIVTTKRKPSEMSLSDIIGEYLIDGEGVEEYLGLENLGSAEKEGWVAISNTANDSENVLRLAWGDQDDPDNVGFDVYKFVDIVTGDPFDNYCISFEDFLNIWYVRSGRNSNFNPDNIDMYSFYQELNLWNGLDSKNRVLWDEYDSNNVSLYFLGGIYPPIQYRTLKGDEFIDIYKNSELVDNQLIRVKDIPVFDLYNTKFDGTIEYPTAIKNDANGATTIIYNGSANGWDFTPKIEYVSDFSPSDINDTTSPDIIYYNDLDKCNGVPNSMTLKFRVISDREGINILQTYTPNIDVTFGNDYIYTFNVVSKSRTGGQMGAYTVLLNDNWRTSTVANPNSSLYEGVYESYSNYNVNNETATMTISISGYKKFSIYIRSDAETTWDYVMASQLDKTITGSTSYNDTTLVKAHTSGNQQSGTAISNYTLVEYDNIPMGTHTITIVYRKDSGVNSGTDRGYVLISKNNETYPVTSNITAKCNNIKGFSLKELGIVKNIDYSQLYFQTVGSILTTVTFNNAAILPSGCSYKVCRTTGAVICSVSNSNYAGTILSGQTYPEPEMTFVIIPTNKNANNKTLTVTWSGGGGTASFTPSGGSMTIPAGYVGNYVSDPNIIKVTLKRSTSSGTMSGVLNIRMS